jgi:hypothetical protein
MNESSRGRSRHRDFLWMSLLGLLTVAVICVSAELLARTRFYELHAGLSACLDDRDATKGVRGVPNTVCHEKSLESDDIEYRLDSRGYRSVAELSPKEFAAYRIVLIGSSVAMGEQTQLRSSPAALLAPRLAALTGRKVEVYNEGMAWGFARNANLRFSDAIDAQPDLILWLVTPLDVARSEGTMVRTIDTPPAGKGIQRLKASVLHFIRQHGGDIVIGQVLRHYLFEHESADQYVRAALQGQTPDDESAFLMVAPGPAWRQHWTDFSGHARDMFQRARAAGIPMAVAFVPNRVQAAMISAGEWPAGYDPYAIDRTVETMVSADGGKFIELLPLYRAVPGTEHFYLALDGHPTTPGYAFLAESLARQLTAGAIPALRAARR